MNSTTIKALEVFPAQLEAHYAAIPAEFNPTLASVDSEALVEVRSYATANAEDAFAAFREKIE
jgi:hypothetical protein